MAILKCKMCGGDLNITAEEKIIECEYCGSTQTIPEGNDEKKTNLFNRANRLRMDNEFDKAAGVYESIVSESPEEAEGYWGLVLCSYGIEYVDDAKTGKKIPTCHRTLTSSVMDDDNFVQACENADVVARGIYREEAKAIDKLQRQIIAVVENEEPYDVFICYKETDDITKSRTEDSLIAQDIYTELIKEGYKVFFSRVTLRDKAGTEYEPYIYAALKSAKIMLAIGTKFDYYDAVWVKNEWSRYISMMADDSSKHLIPCFKNLDAYDIPKEFKNLQALDMGEVTFFKNLTDNVSRIIPKQTTEQPKVVEIQSDSNSATTDSLLKRAFMFLEDGNWKSAEEYCEKVLDIDPECAKAYLGKLMAELRVKKQEELKECQETFSDKVNYQKVIRFANEKLKHELDIYIKFINEKIEKQLEEERLERETMAKEFSKTLEKFKIKNMQTSISAGLYHTVGLKLNGTVVAIGGNRHGQCNVSDWTDIVAVSAGDGHTVGLKSDGSVIATKYIGDQEFNYGQSEVSGWRDIIAVSVGDGHTVGLKANGAVVAVGDNNDGQCNVSNWKDIVVISAGGSHTVGLKADGTVVAVGDDFFGKCNVSDWRDIVAISAGSLHTVGLRSDGTVVAVGDIAEGLCDVKSWTDIVAISAGSRHTVGLKSDGTVVTTGDIEEEEYDVTSWKNIVAISADRDHTVGLKSDGSVVAIGCSDDNQCDVCNWKDIFVPINANTIEEYQIEKAKLTEIRRKKYAEVSVESERKISKLSKAHEKLQVKNRQSPILAKYHHTVGLKSDGTVVATKCMSDKYNHGQCDVEGWTDIVAISAATFHTVGLKSNGTVVATRRIGEEFNYGQSEVFGWKDIVAISAAGDHTVGLKADGTVVAVGDNHFGKCDVTGWTDIVAIFAEDGYTVGLKSNGTVVATGDGSWGRNNVTDWTDIIDLSISDNRVVGLKLDGKVVATGYNESGQSNVSNWSNVVEISSGPYHTVGLKSDGTVVATKHIGEFFNYGQSNVKNWTDIVAISTTWDCTIGLKSDGTVVVAGNENYKVTGWTDIVAISAGSYHIVGLKSDGTVVATGSNEVGKCNVSNWTDISIPVIAETKEELEKEKRKMLTKRNLMKRYRNAGLCQHCGGQFKGLFSKTCTKCGKKKDY